MSEGTVTPNETTIAANTMTGFGGSLTIAASVLDVEIPGKIGFAVDVLWAPLARELDRHRINNGMRAVRLLCWEI